MKPSDERRSIPLLFCLTPLIGRARGARKRKSRDKAARPVDEKRVKVYQMNEKQGLRGSIERRIRSFIEAFRPNVRPYLDPTECSAEEDNR